MAIRFTVAVYPNRQSSPSRHVALMAGEGMFCLCANRYMGDNFIAIRENRYAYWMSKNINAGTMTGMVLVHAEAYIQEGGQVSICSPPSDPGCEVALRANSVGAPASQLVR
jgi:hypothetical protein